MTFFNFSEVKSYIFNFLSYLAVQLILVLFEKLKLLASQEALIKTL